jgi:hypothetical protein
MDTKFQSGQKVTVKSSRGHTEVIVARDLGDVILVCRPEEYRASKSELRAPICVGFKKRDVIDSV